MRFFEASIPSLTQTDKVTAVKTTHQLQNGPHLDHERSLDLTQLEPDSDIYAFAIDQIVSVSPTGFDLTARVGLNRLEWELRRD